MQSFLLMFAAALCLSEPLAASAQAMPSDKRVPELAYRVVPDFFSYPPDWIAGEASGVALNSKGHIFLFQRAKPMLSEFDEAGHYVRSLGEGLFDHPHGLRIDVDDNIWTTDDTNHTVLKLSPAGKVLLVLGRRNNGGEANWLFNKPADVAIAPGGEIYVADGYGNSRIVKFDRHGNFIRAWGSYGSAPGEFMLPHSVVVDKSGRVYVGDRENARIQIFDPDGNFVTQWTGIGYPYGLVITPDQHVWMVDGGFDRIVELDPNGKILGAIGSPGHEPGQFAWGHFMAIGADKRMYVADVLNWRFQAFIPTKPSGRLSDYVPTQRMFFGFKQSDGYIYRSPGWPVK
jgi:DNA-binding beta-propeller fold protein YncE